MKPLSRSMVRHAHAIARETGARVVLLYADVLEEGADLTDMIQGVDFRIILATKRTAFQVPEGWDEICKIVRVPDVTMTRAGQIKVATLVASAERLIQTGDRIVCLSGLDSSGLIDTIAVGDKRQRAGPEPSTRLQPLPGLPRRLAQHPGHSPGRNLQGTFGH